MTPEECLKEVYLREIDRLTAKAELLGKLEGVKLVIDFMASMVKADPSLKDHTICREIAGFTYKTVLELKGKFDSSQSHQSESPNSTAVDDGPAKEESPIAE